MFKIEKFWCRYQTIFGVVIKPFLGLNTNLDDNLYWRLYTRLRLSTGFGRQFRFGFIQEDDLSYRRSTIGESADTTQKGVSALAKNHAATVFLWQRDAVWSKVFMVMLAV